MYGFLLRPKWLAGHVIAFVAIVAFVNLGLWQLRRLDERRGYNTTVSQRATAPVQPLSTLLPPRDGEPEALAYRRVAVEGSYRRDAEVLLSTRSRGGRPGHHVLTPLVTSEGRAVVVDRGWVPYEVSDPPIEAAAPPPGTVHVEGVVLPGQPTDQFGRDEDGRLEFVSAVDLDRLARLSSAPLYPVYVELRSQSPRQRGPYPLPAEPLELSEGPHLSYAVQWFLFAGVVGIGYPVLLARTAREDPRPPGPPDAHVAHDPPAVRMR